MTSLIRDLGPKPHETAWRAAQHRLAGSDTAIGHIDTGLFAHPSLGFEGDMPPGNIRIAEGLNLHDPERAGVLPLTDLRRGTGPVARASEYPDHGVKTLSVILSDNEHLRGVAPGAQVIPYRIANGPVFVGAARTDAIGAALRHGMARPKPPRVFSVSMGNTGAIGPFELLRAVTGGHAGMARQTADAINAAYDAGIIVVCAGGQVIDRVVYPARFARTIAVGGITATETHYPSCGYDAPHMIDVWAYASHINRAAGLRVGDNILPIHADTPHPDNRDDEPSGTSYACPQVAAAAAMWVTAHERELARFDERWKIVEAFRHALRQSARPAHLPFGAHRPGGQHIRRLDIDALLRMPPDLRHPYTKARRARRLTSLL